MGVVIDGGITFQNYEPDSILENSKGDFKTVLVIGYGFDGQLITSSSTADLDVMNTIVDLAKRRILKHIEAQRQLRNC